MMFGLLMVLKPWFHTSGILRRIGRWLWPLYLGVTTPLVFFVEAASKSFIDEYDSRPNFLFVEYLGHPREVLATLTGSHLVELIVFTGIAVLLGVLTIRWLRNDPRSAIHVSVKSCLLLTPVAAILAFLMIRSTLDHRPVNPSNATFSQDAMVNQLALNSPYSLLYAIYEQRRDATSKGLSYGAMDDDEVLDIVIQEANIEPLEPSNPSAPTLHHQTATRSYEKPLNLVIILEESLGAEFVGSLGGLDLTPELDDLASEGIWFERLYATGIRSVRGIEAIITGFTPTPRRSVVKLLETQVNFFTLAGLLQNQGYLTSFVYGGEAHFDNMKRFFLNNGFQTVIDEKDYKNPVFYGSWGVSDEDLFNRANNIYVKAGEKPFFSVVFTSSNHDPYDLPENRVAPQPGPEGPRHTAVKYADYALGQYIDMARQSDYWENTVFLIVADHNSRVKGAQLVPVKQFHIPGLIIGGTIKPRRIPGISSQIDLLPTLLSLMGVNGNHPAIGRDLTRPEYADGAGRAIMQFHRIQSYLEGDRMVVLQPDLEPTQFHVDSRGNAVLATDSDPELARKSLAHALWAPLMIRLKAYHN